MPDENIRTTLQFQTDITEFKAAMQEANRAVKLANSEFNAASSGMDDWASSADGLAAKLRQLSSVQQAEQRKLDALRESYAKVAKEQGENSAEAQKLLVQINNQQAAVNKTEKAYRTYAAKLEEVEKAADGAAGDIKKVGDAAEDAGKDAEDSAGGWSIVKDVIANFVKDTISGAIDSLVSLAESTRDYRREMALMAGNAAASGHDMEAMKNTLAGVAAVTGDSEAAMEGLNMLMATGMNTENLTLAAEAMAGAASKFDGVNFEGIAEGLQETIATGAAVGPFSEIIERSGGNLEKFNEGMAKCTTEAERQQYALQWLKDSGLKGVHDSYVQNNADLVEAEKAQFRYNDALAKVGAAVEPLNTKLSQIGTTILESVAPIVENIVQWVLDNLPLIGPIIAGIAAALGVLAGALAIQGLITGVTKAFALLNTTMLANPAVLIGAIITGVLVAAFVALWNKSEAFRKFWINMWAGIKSAFSAVASWFSKTAASIADFFVKAWNTIKKNWSTSTIGKYFGQVWNTIKGVFSVVKSVLSGNFSDAWAAIKGVFSGWGSFFSDLWSQVKSAFANVGQSMLSIGKNIVQGIWNGISGAYTWIKDKISGWVGNVLDFIKNLFGIHSPSTVMRDQVGKMLGLGMAEGITDSKKNVQSAMRGLNEVVTGAPGSGSSAGGMGGAVGGKTIIINQTNNSPRALSRREIYRQTHNALAFAGGA